MVTFPTPYMTTRARNSNEKELADLTLSSATVNAWNRLSIAARLTPGTYGDTT
jgi:alkylhydroperoxidase family enzyme